MDRPRAGETLRQELPPLFAHRLTHFLNEGEVPLASLFVPAGDGLGPRAPACALILTTAGVLSMEQGEVLLRDTPWGVKTLFYPYARITAVGMGSALLMGRFTLHGQGNAPICEIVLGADDVPRFEAAARIIGERVAAH